MPWSASVVRLPLGVTLAEYMESEGLVVTGGSPECAACGCQSEGRHSVHRDGFDDGPEVWLCDACGARPLPTLEAVWAAIARRMPLRVTCYLDPQEAPT